MTKLFLILTFLAVRLTADAQTLFLPEPVTNNSVAAVTVKGKTVVYSFYGLDSSKKWSGVHKKVFKINIDSKNAKYIGEVPDSAGRIASSASTIKNKIYVVGGYTVYADRKEKSSAQIFIFDPQKENFTKAADLLFPIDDHIQSVWRDSLLFIITGWNDSNNISAVQVYNPFTNQWKLATPVPDEREAKVFGGCGIIIKDTIYYLGGAAYEKLYPPVNILYKGIIDPNNPYKIKWIRWGEFTLPYRYRSSAFYAGRKIYFFGGSNETYNYDGISYQGKKPVNPNSTVLIYDLFNQKFSLKEIPVNMQRMDLRNIVSAGRNKWVIAGGMKINQRVSNEAVIIQLNDIK
ncbi:MAG: Kelch repeat-containing protein [Sphingobacteriales bacterium]